MHLPNAENAVVDSRKLINYVLNFEDPRGRHKARVFKSALGYTAENANELSRAVLAAAAENECLLGELDFYGQRYTVDCRIRTDEGEATVRTGWIILKGEDFPRLTTCFVLKERRGIR